MGSALRRRHGPSHQSFALERSTKVNRGFDKTQSHWTCCLVLKGRAMSSLFELNVRRWWSARERAVRDIERPGL